MKEKFNYFFLISFVGAAIWFLIDGLNPEYIFDWWFVYVPAGTFLILACVPAINLFAPEKIKKASFVFIIVGMGGIIALAVSSPNRYKPAALDSNAKSNLYDLYLACKGYWGEKGSDMKCNATVVSSPAYGYTQSQDVVIEGGGVEKNFNAKSFHPKGNKVFTINASGEIQGVNK